MGVNVIHYSSFTAPDGTLLTAYIPNIGAGWANILGSCDINTNRATYAGGTFAVCVTDTSKANCVITGLFSSENTASSVVFTGISFRAVDSNNYFYVIIYVVGGNVGMYLYERTTGTDTLRASALRAYTSNTQYQFTLTLSGDNITCTDGTISVNYTTSVRNTATKHGVMFRGSNNNTNADDYTVTA